MKQKTFYDAIRHNKSEQIEEKSWKEGLFAQLKFYELLFIKRTGVFSTDNGILRELSFYNILVLLQGNKTYYC